MKSTLLTVAFLVLAYPANAASTTHKFTPPTVSKQQEQAYNQTYKTDMAQEKHLKSSTGTTHG